MAYRAIMKDDPRHSLAHWKYLSKRKVNGKWQYVYEVPKNEAQYVTKKNEKYIGKGMKEVTNDPVQPGKQKPGIYTTLDGKTGYTQIHVNNNGTVSKASSENLKNATNIQGDTGDKKKTVVKSTTVQGKVNPTDKIKNISKATVKKGKDAIDKILNKVTKKSEKKTLEEIYGKKKKADFEFKI